MKIGRISERGKNGRQEINFYLGGAPRRDCDHRNSGFIAVTCFGKEPEQGQDEQLHESTEAIIFVFLPIFFGSQGYNYSCQIT